MAYTYQQSQSSGRQELTLPQNPWVLVILIFHATCQSRCTYPLAFLVAKLDMRKEIERLPLEAPKLKSRGTELNSLVIK